MFRPLGSVYPDIKLPRIFLFFSHVFFGVLTNQLIVLRPTTPSGEHWKAREVFDKGDSPQSHEAVFKG